jgi:hypothetical protein
VPKDTVVISCGIGAVVCPGVNVTNPTKNYWYLFKYLPTDEKNPARGPTPTRRRARSC